MSNSAISGMVSKAVSKKYGPATSAWNDPNSGFKTSKYGQQYQQELDAYNQKRADYLKQRGWAENSLAKGSGIFYTVTKGEGTDNGAYTERVQMNRARALQRAIGSAPSIVTYYNNWVNAGSPSYKEATDNKADNTTKDSLAPSASDSGSSGDASSAPTKKGYDIQGSTARGHGYSPSSSDDSGEGGTGQRTGDSGDDLGTGTPSGERLKKQFKPLGK